MRLALFGGTFDPIHRGHLAIAGAAADAFALDRILFAPVGHQPLKSEAPHASFTDRLAMVTLACAADPRFCASDLDAPRPDGQPNYTIDTLARLTLQYSDAAPFVLTGADSFLTLRHWREPNRLLALADWIVVSRPGSSLAEADLAPLALTPAQRLRVHLLSTVHEDVSATALRHRLHLGDPCLGLLPPAVSAYLQVHPLYR